jgi:hypothetical protein
MRPHPLAARAISMALTVFSPAWITVILPEAMCRMPGRILSDWGSRQGGIGKAGGAARACATARALSC